MNERDVRRDTTINGRRVMRRSKVLVGGRTMHVFHMEHGKPVEVRPGAFVEGARPAGQRPLSRQRVLALDAGCVRVPSRIEIITAVMDSQTQRGDRRSLATMRLR